MFESGWVDREGGKASPFGSSCTTWETCFESTGTNFIGSVDKHEYWIACLECPKGWREGRMNAGEQVKNKCVSLSFPTKCYAKETFSTWTSCPVSEYRTNECSYLKDDAWHVAAAGSESPLKDVCAQYSLCDSTLLDGPWPAADSKPTDKYYLMCTQCAAGLSPLSMNTVSKGTCAGQSYPVSCVAPGPAPTPATTAPTLSPVVHPPGVLEQVKKYAIFIAVAAVVLLVAYLVVNKVRRERKKRVRMAKEIENAKNGGGGVELENKTKKGAKAKKNRSNLENTAEKNSFVGMGEMPEQMAASRQQMIRQESGNGNDAEKEARRQKKREKEAALKDALNEGLPDFWRAFTDKSTGGVFYYNSVSARRRTFYRPGT